MSLEHTYLLDSEGLSRAARGERVLGAQLRYARRRGFRVITTSMTLIEAYDMKASHAAWRWTLSRIHVEPVTEDIAHEAIALLREVGLHGHKYAIDSVLAVIAKRQTGPVTVFTSDRDDMDLLCGERVVVFEL